MILQLKAKHFKDTEFCSSRQCAIAKAAKEKFPEADVWERIYFIEINDVIHEHDYYGIDAFNYDLNTASSHSFDETVIREIELTKTN